MLDSVSLALAFYKAPFEHQELRQPQFLLPEDTDRLLRIAGSNTQDSLDLNQGSNPKELKDAAVFFIQQVFFIDEANHYRVLGLNPGTEQKRVKEHHRLLIRLFHPDRHHTQEVWTEIYAERVNEAYNVLRKPDSRRAYDLTLVVEQTVNRQTVDASATNKGFHRNTVSPGKIPKRRLPRFLQRNLPQTLLGGTAFVAALLVFSVYLSNHSISLAIPPILSMFAGKTQTADELPRLTNENNDATEVKHRLKVAKATVEQHLPQIESKPKAARKVVETVVAAPTPLLSMRSSVSDENTKQLQQSSKNTKQLQQSSSNNTIATIAPPPHPIDVAPSSSIYESIHKKTMTPEINASFDTSGTAQKTSPKQTSAEKILKKNTPQSSAKLAKKPDSKVLQPKKTAETRKSALSSPITPTKPIPQAKFKPVPTKSITSPSVFAKAKGSEVSGIELEVLTSLFIGAYERGSAEELMRLFDERAHANNKTGKSSIRQDYESFFVKTRAREMNLRQLRWQKNGLSASGQGVYQVRVKGEQGMKSYTGTIRFEVKKKDKRVLITKLSHKALF